jgi:hypothetical protein
VNTGAARRRSSRSGPLLRDSVEPDRAGQTNGGRQTVIGTVQKVEGDTLVVKSSTLSDPHRIEIAKDTRLTRDARQISRDQINEGDQVRATFSGEGKATEISVITEERSSSGGAPAPSASTTGAAEPNQAGQQR